MDAGTGGRCAYVHDSADSEWSCPHDAVTGRDVCAFHLPPSEYDAVGLTDADVSERLLACVRDDTQRHNEFVGAHFGTLDARNVTVESDHAYPVRLTDVTVDGDLRIDSANVVAELIFDGSTVHGQVCLDGTRFVTDVSFVDCTFGGIVSASTTKFEGGVVFARATFEDAAAFDAGATFLEDAVFTDTDFGGPAQFRGALFENRVFFRGAHFTADADFAGSVVEAIATFEAAAFDGETSFRNSRFAGPVKFGGRTDTATTFADAPDFRRVTAEESLDFTEVTFADGVDFADAGFEADVDFTDAEIYGEVVLDQASCGEQFRFAPADADLDTYVSCDRTTIRGGVLHQPREGRLLFDFRQGRLGDVDAQGTPANDAIDFLRFVNTTFDGFDFTTYRPRLEPDYRIHRFDVATDVAPVDLTAREEELTYMKAKAGADRIGDGRCQSGFFVREMRARGQRARDRRKDAGGPREWLRATLTHSYNRAFDWTCEYAEDPHRLVGVMFGVILAYAGLFWAGFRAAGTTLEQGSTTPDAVMHAPVALDYILLSGEAFTTIVYYPAAVLPSWQVRLIAVSESLVGVLLSALFLFTLTRAVHR
ncbi:pentapeptide repeat-containing protein [Halocalculus aciditolerans]|uniref:Pentapeptide repeat-containing protein n=1 Tax=Halocalculus aciditolerans TaxID=1383812 RepID=A0A830F1X9_9EURY|nr:pentapeptide repeat-containing protein [Halocalculus aciditolerans]GGL53944.1 hypothetical protein GCM10009039_10180 [Halocalculus aciditolerans]